MRRFGNWRCGLGRRGAVPAAERSGHRAYQSECGDQRRQERQHVEVHRRRQAGQTPPVSKVFHRCPQEQDQTSHFRGDQPHCGQLTCGPDGPTLSSCSSSSSRTVDDSAEAYKRERIIPVLYSALVSESLVIRTRTKPVSDAGWPQDVAIRQAAKAGDSHQRGVWRMPCSTNSSRQCR